jgi:propionyl-CoA carboxylase alpha chain
MFDKILIANRGEIALRVIRTCRKLGVGTVAVYSDVDFRSPHVREADEAVYLGPAPASQSYLVKDKIIEATLSRDCQAIHPGYGFLSENAEFARLATSAGIAFIGPPAEAIATLGDKMASKVLALRVGVPVVPGHHEPLSDLDEARSVAEQIGYPLLLKPAAGGGGRGMRIVNDAEELPNALVACQDETRKSFADDRIFIERFVARPRHIEIQIIADQHGNVLFLGERECSVQRRYQKVIEECPSVSLDDGLRQEMGQIACTLSREAGYTNAGTVEFILDEDRRFYFLEMNTRLQVEHTVTEWVTGVDLVELQLRVANGESLPLKQRDVRLQGWAIEARICAEDPSRDFFPTTGMITRYALPKGRNIRVDDGVAAGSVVTIHYDSLLAKVIAYGENREQARESLIQALNGYHIAGITTNIDFANSIVAHPAFAEGDLSTLFIEEYFEGGIPKEPPLREHLHYMVLAVTTIYHFRQSLVRDSLKPMATQVGGKPVARRYYDYVIQVSDGVFHARVEGTGEPQKWRMAVDGIEYEVVTPPFEFYRRRLKLKINGRYHMFRARYQEHHIQAAYCGIVRTFEIYAPREWELAAHMPPLKKKAEENVLRCPMPGLVVAVNVEEGSYVRRGQELVRIESMKMESAVAAPREGLVGKVSASPGETVETGDPLLEFAEPSCDG